jgi:hypothetical protein
MYCKHPVGGEGRRNFDPLVYGRLYCWAQVARELCENTLPIALAVSFAGERAIKHRPDTEHEHDGPDR